MLLIVLTTKIVVFVAYSRRHNRELTLFLERTDPNDYQPMVSVIVPCFNESVTVENCVISLRDQTYENIEIILVDDGSTDDTWKVLRSLRREGDGSQLQVLSKQNGGKASALNHGVVKSCGEIIVCVDADSIFVPDTVAQLVRSFQDPSVAAVGGNVRVANRRSFLTRHQTAEYISGLTIQRRAFSHMGCMQVISGAIGAFRREALETIGGYSSDTIVEDMDITITLARHNLRVVYNPLALAYTEAPEDLRDFLKQRYRWAYGNFEVLRKHRVMLGNRRYGSMGLVGLPYCAIFPWVDAFISVVLMSAVVRVVMQGNPWSLLFFYVVLATIQAGVLLYALKLDHEDKRLVVMSYIEHLFYSHVINLVTVFSGLNYQFGRKATWNKLKRLGRNTVSKPVDDAVAPRILETTKGR